MGKLASTLRWARGDKIKLIIINEYKVKQSEEGSIDRDVL